VVENRSKIVRFDQLQHNDHDSVGYCTHFHFSCSIEYYDQTDTAQNPVWKVKILPLTWGFISARVTPNYVFDVIYIIKA